jgi:hypothetical protein
MMAPTSFFYRGDISLGTFCILVGLALIVVELADISAALENNQNT